MVAPAISSIAAEFKITSEVEQQMVLSVFVLAYAIGPLFLGPLSEIYGRVPVLQLANLFFLVFNTACGGSRNKGEMIAFRFLSGLGGSAPLAIGGGVLSDCWRTEERGRAISLYTLGPLLGPAIGPIAGGFITENTTFRWAFYAVSITDAVIQLSGLFFLRETYAPKLLHIKAEKLRKQTGNMALHTEFEHPERSFANTMERALIRPFKLLGTQPIVQVLAVYMAYLYGLMYLVLSTFPILWTQRYHESIGMGGLNYISLTLGFFLGTQICAPMNDKIYRRLKRRNGGNGSPEFRTPLMVPGSVLVPCGLFIYGWSAQYHTHWIVPNIGAALFSAGIVITFQCIQTYIIDSYVTYAASAIAAATVLRSSAGFGFPLFAPYMYHALDYGWGNSLLGFIAIGIGLPAPVLLWLFGKILRERSPFAAGWRCTRSIRRALQHRRVCSVFLALLHGWCLMLMILRNEIPFMICAGTMYCVVVHRNPVRPSRFLLLRCEDQAVNAAIVHFGCLQVRPWVFRRIADPCDCVNFDFIRKARKLDANRSPEHRTKTLSV